MPAIRLLTRRSGHQVADKIRTLTDQLVPRADEVGTEPINVRFYSKDLPQLSLVDLPGLIQVNNADQAEVRACAGAVPSLPFEVVGCTVQTGLCYTTLIVALRREWCSGLAKADRESGEEVCVEAAHNQCVEAVASSRATSGLVSHSPLELCDCSLGSGPCRRAPDELARHAPGKGSGHRGTTNHRRVDQGGQAEQAVRGRAAQAGRHRQPHHQQRRGTRFSVAHARLRCCHDQPALRLGACGR